MDELLHMAVKLPRALDSAEFVAFAAVEVQHRVAGVEDELEIRGFDPVEQFQCMLPGHATVIVAVFMQVENAGLLAHPDQKFDLAENMRFDLGIPGGAVPLRPEAHAADHFAVQPLHADQRPLQLFDRRLEILFLHRVPAPVRHSAAEAVDADAGCFKLDRLELLLRQIVDVDAVNRARFDPLPAKLFRRFDLAGDSPRRFVRKSGIVHLPELLP